MLNTTQVVEEHKSLQTKVLGYIGYLLGSVFIVLIWLFEKSVMFFKRRKKKEILIATTDIQDL